MLDTTKRTLATLTAATFLGAGGWAVAQSTSTTPNAQSQGSTTQAPSGYGYGRSGGSHRGMGETVSADVLAKITAAVQAKLAGSTVERAMKAPDGTYHAHVVQKDGTPVHVALSSAFAVTSVDQGMRGGPGRHGGQMGTAASAAELAKVKAAVVAKLPGATVGRAMKKSDGTFHAHVTKSDGTEVHVTLSSAFAVTQVDTLMGSGRGGPGGRHGQETPLTGETAAKVKAAALAKLPGATVDRLETDADGGKYEAHVTKADGTHATVKVDASFTVTAVENH
jgi:uncharacterized membrane protein YkoI